MSHLKIGERLRPLRGQDRQNVKDLFYSVPLWLFVITYAYEDLFYSVISLARRAGRHSTNPGEQFKYVERWLAKFVARKEEQ